MSRLIPEEYILNKNIKYKLIKRNSALALYEQRIDDDLIGYEVVKIKKVTKQLTYKLGNSTITNEAGEYLPNSNRWGVDGFSYRDLTSATEKFDRWSEQLKIGN